MPAKLPARFAALAAAAAAHAERADFAAAARAWREAVAVLPTHAAAWHNLGVVEALGGRHAEALDALAKAAGLAPTWAEPLVALAHTHLRQRRYSLAIPHLVRARALSPAHETIWWLLRGTLLALGRDEDALADLRAFEAVAAPSARLVVAVLASARRVGDAGYEARALAAALAYPYAPGDAPLVSELLGIVQYFDVDAHALLALYDTYDRLVREDLAARAEAPVEIAAGVDARRSVGYLSADFRGHVMGELLAPVVEAHDRARHRITLFSVALPGHDDATTARFRAAADDMIDLAALDDAAAARAIAAAGIDVLVDLMGHSAFARPAILARKPARRVVTHLGYHGAVGLASIDAKITDAIADLPDGAGALREHLVPLDVCVLPLRPYRPPGVRYARRALGLAPGAVVVAAFVPVQKLSPRCLALWRSVLERVPAAVLLLSPPRDDDRTALARRLAGFGIAADRVAFVPYEAAHRHDRYALADLALDTLPYGGGDTTAAALAAGVPVVTRAGRRHAERMSASILTHAGLADLVVDGDDAFVELAVRLATDVALRDEVRARVRAALGVPSLTDPARYARALERAYARVLSDPPRNAS